MLIGYVLVIMAMRGSLQIGPVCLTHADCCPASYDSVNDVGPVLDDRTIIKCENKSVL